MSSLDASDLVRFASVVTRYCAKKGYLNEVKRGSEIERGFYCLFGNLMYCFENDSDPNSVKGLIFLESSTCKISSTPSLSVSTVGGRTYNFTGRDMGELYEWLNAIESSKMVNVTRKIEDSETSLVALRHKVEHLEDLHVEHEKTYVQMKAELEESRQEVSVTKQQLDQISKSNLALQAELRALESERLLLLKSRGITPKRTPNWAVVGELSDDMSHMKVWTGTWNLQGHEPFPAMDKDRAKRLLRTFVPSGYDMYILAVQECPNDSLFECFDALLEGDGLRRVPWAINNHNISSFYNSLNTAVSEGGAGGDPSKLFGRGKDSLRSVAFLSIAVYVRNKIASDVQILAMASETLTGGNDCQGGVAMALNVFGRIIAVVNTEFDGKSNDARRDQYQHLFMELGSKLAETSYHLNEQFHHVIWMGDMSHNLVDTSGNQLPIESAVQMLGDGRVTRTLFDTHDELNRDKKQQIIFFNYREAAPYPNFYPTYRKIRNRAPVDYGSESWVRNTYLLTEKGSFFKGGKVKEHTPGFSDRILYYSMVDVAEDLLPESLPADLEIVRPHTGKAGELPAANQPMHKVISIDNYRSVNDGEGMTISEHSPVYCTFLLRLRHDHDAAQAPAQPSAGDINNLLSALTIPETPERPSKADAQVPVPPPTAAGRQSPLPPTPSGAGVGKSVFDSPAHSGPSSRPAPLLRPLSRSSLLPVGTYRVRISGLKLIWGMNEIFPVRAGILFPTPYEAVAGERFVDFMSEIVPVATPASFSGSFSNNGGGGTPNRNSKKLQAGSGACKGDPQWRNAGPSRTGTSLCLQAGRSVQEYSQPGSNALPPVLLTWRGEEPLDRLHISLKLTMMTQAIRSGRMQSAAGSGKGSGHGGEEDDVMVGHCALSLEQLCKVAASNAGDSCSVTATRMLVCRGRPMYCVDPSSMQREIVSFHCKLELAHR